MSEFFTDNRSGASGEYSARGEVSINFESLTRLRVEAEQAGYGWRIDEYLLNRKERASREVSQAEAIAESCIPEASAQTQPTPQKRRVLGFLGRQAVR